MDEAEILVETSEFPDMLHMTSPYFQALYPRNYTPSQCFYS